MRKLSLALFTLALVCVVLVSECWATFGVKTGSNGQWTIEITDIQLGKSVNWTYSGSVLTLNGTNWQNISGVNLSQVNWTNAFIPGSGINWSSVTGANTSMINWTNNYLPNAGINWYDIQASQMGQGTTTGINWYELNPIAGGINWMVVTKAAADNTILCVKSGGIGKCASGFSASGAGSCTCI